MTKSTLFDRLNQELEAFGKKAQAALDEGKLQIELLRLARQRDNAARDLGLLVHRGSAAGKWRHAGWMRCCSGWTISGPKSRGWSSRWPRPEAEPAPGRGRRRQSRAGLRCGMARSIRRRAPPGCGRDSCRRGRPRPCAPTARGRRSRSRSRRSISRPPSWTWLTSSRSTCCHSCHSVVAPTARIAETGSSRWAESRMPRRSSGRARPAGG